MLDGTVIESFSGYVLQSRALFVVTVWERRIVCVFSQAQGALPAGSLVSALLIDDLGSMPVPEDIPMVVPAL